jgi:hypothetical protein
MVVILVICSTRKGIFSPEFVLPAPAALKLDTEPSVTTLSEALLAPTQKPLLFSAALTIFPSTTSMICDAADLLSPSLFFCVIVVVVVDCKISVRTSSLKAVEASRPLVLRKQQPYLRKAHGAPHFLKLERAETQQLPMQPLLVSFHCHSSSRNRPQTGLYSMP